MKKITHIKGDSKWGRNTSQGRTVKEGIFEGSWNADGK